MGAITGTMFAVLFSALAGGIWIGLTLGATGALLLALFRSIPLDKLLAQYAWNILTTQELLALPMFILMGEILFQSRLSRSLFQGLAPWAGRLPGRLLHVNVVGCSIFAAISGSSAATTQGVGRIALAEPLKSGYSKDIAIGPPAGAGTLGFLIPPSNIMIIYGVLGDVSILKLFTAGFIPGFMLAGCFMLWVMIHTGLRRVVVLGAIIVAALQGGLTLKAMRDIAIGAVLTCSMIAMILLGASILGSAAAFLGIPRAVADFVASMGLSPFMLIVALIVFYLILGCFLDGFSMIVMTLPIVLPIVKQAGFDPVWFGIFLVLVVEMAQITPPVGFNLFVIQGLTGDGLGYIAKVTLPYLAIMVLFTLLITVFPQIALFLPNLLAGR